MEIRETLISPSMAAQWLEGNTHNRAVRDATVQRYARDMQAGLWRLTHQGIAFGPDGELLDGQHRLWAIVMSERAIKMMVARGVPADAQAVIDDNMPRSAGDALKLIHKTTARTVEVAMAKRLLEDTLHSYKPTRQEIVAAFRKHSTAISFASSVFPKMLRGVTTAPVMSVVARAWYSQDREKLAHFGEVLTTGRPASTADDIVLTLRDWLINGAARRTPGMSRDTAIYGKTERALLAFLEGHKIANLVAATSELFPLPVGMAEPKPAQVVSTRELRRKLAS